MAARKVKPLRGQFMGETLAEFRQRQRAARKAGTTVPGEHGGSRWDGRKKFPSEKRGNKFVNHLGQETHMALIFGLFKQGASDPEIVEAMKARFPEAGFHNDPKKQLRAYRSHFRRWKRTGTV